MSKRILILVLAIGLLLSGIASAQPVKEKIKEQIKIPQIITNPQTWPGLDQIDPIGNFNPLRNN